MKYILLILLVLLFIFMIFYNEETFSCNIIQSCNTIKCNDNQLKATLINDPNMCKCCDLDYINENNNSIKLYYNFDSTTIKDNKMRNMSIKTDSSNNLLVFDATLSTGLLNNILLNKSPGLFGPSCANFINTNDSIIINTIK